MTMLSAVIPTIGRERYLDLALESLIPQTAFDEIVVFDNSAGQSLACTSRWGKDPRVRWERSGGGLPPISSWNNAVSACRTPWVAIFGDDDLAGPEFGAALRGEVGEAGLVYAPFYLIDENGQRHPDRPAIPASSHHDAFRHRRMRGELYCVIPGFAFRREDFLAVGGFRRLGLPNDLYCDDDLWFRIAARAGQVRVVPRRTWSYRRHAQQVARKFDFHAFLLAVDGYIDHLERALIDLGVPLQQIYPPRMGREGYRRRLVEERFELWLRHGAGAEVAVRKAIRGLPVSPLRRVLWLVKSIVRRRR